MIEYMGAFAELFGFTPTEYRALSHGDWMALKAYIGAREKAAKKGGR